MGIGWACRWAAGACLWCSFIGLALNQRAYRQMLCCLAGMGFLVVAVDAAGHGDTHDFHPSKARLVDFAALTLRTLDVLGIDRAVLAGHSMGGRVAIELAAGAPERCWPRC